MKVLTISLLVVGLSTFCNSVEAQEYYVTIGVFANQNNAIHYTALANKAGFNSQYAINPARKLYYVYLYQTEDRKKAYAFLIKLRAETDHKDAWLFEGHLGEEAAEAVPKEPVIEPVVTPIVVPTEPPLVVKKDSVPPVVVAPLKAKGKFFTFKFINEENGNEVRGELHLQESNTATQYQAFKANEMVDVTAPRNQAGAYWLTTVAPGYKVVEETFNFKDPLPSSSGTGPNGELIIPIGLKQVKRGDYIEFNNVSFYRNSVIMQKQSQLEMEGLADIMKENLNYKIKIHGHCNGTESRDIITLGTSQKYFENDPGNVKKSGSAKELTDLRAECVRRYLASQGIAEERMFTKGEGGKMMIYPQTSVYANYNDRVEIEIIRH
jgi:outer membrane protein OmpA-like peptidoglycan-associated protein